MFESVRFNLQRVGIDLLFPEPIRTAELDVFRINGRDFFQGPQEAPSRFTVLEAESNKGNPVLDLGHDLVNRQGVQVVRVFLAVVEKMSIAALQGETERWFVEILDDLDYWRINFGIDERFPAFLLLRFKILVIRQFFWFREGLQLCCPF